MGRRAEKLPISRRLIKQRAIQHSADYLLEGFKASEGWLYRFMNRWRLSLRRATTACQKVPADLIDKLVRFVKFVRGLRRQANYNLAYIYGADELGIWIDSLPETTVETTGARDVPIRTTGHERLRVTVLLAARADGFKLKPAVLIPRKKPIKALDRFKNRLRIIYSGMYNIFDAFLLMILFYFVNLGANSWMDEPKLHEYVTKEIGRSIFGHHNLLVWDAFVPHYSERTRVLLRQLAIDLAVIPGTLFQV